MTNEPDVSGWIEGAFITVAVLLAISAVIRWNTPRPKALRLSSCLNLIAVVVGLVAAIPYQLDPSEAGVRDGYEFVRQGTVVTEAEIDAVPKGSTRAEVRARLGVASAYGRHGLAHLRCLGYRMAPRSVAGLCFHSGRYDGIAEVMPRSAVRW
jgi:hypothetical protein